AYGEQSRFDECSPCCDTYGRSTEALAETVHGAHFTVNVTWLLALASAPDAGLTETTSLLGVSGPAGGGSAAHVTLTLLNPAPARAPTAASRVEPTIPPGIVFRLPLLICTLMFDPRPASPE